MEKVRFFQERPYGSMVELEYTYVLEAYAERIESSNLSAPTIYNKDLV